MMIRLKNVNMLLVFFLGLVVLNVLVEMEKIMVDSVKLVVSNVGEVVDNLINKVGDFMDDSIIIVWVKVVLIDYKDINFGDILVKMENKVVIFSGDVISVEQKSQVLSVVKEVKGVLYVNDKLMVYYKLLSEMVMLKGYVGDIVIISEVKVKLLVDDIVFLCNVKVEINVGVVYLIGMVVFVVQVECVVEIVKVVFGVKSVCNDFSVK